VWERISNLVGMEEATDQVRLLYNRAKGQERRRELGIEDPLDIGTMHMVFEGPPGTGKTTMAEEIGQLYYALGILDKPGVHTVTRDKLVGGFEGQTAIKTSAEFDKAKGGVLFIDEAYALNEGEDDTYGHEALTTLLTLAEANRTNTVVILAGYGDTVERLSAANEGLKSRFPTKIDFEPFDLDDKKEIFRRMTKGFGVGKEGTPQGDATRKAVDAAIKLTEKTNGNARDIRNLVDAIYTAQQDRLAEDPDLASMPIRERKRAEMFFETADVITGARRWARQNGVTTPVLVPVGKQKVS